MSRAASSTLAKPAPARATDPRAVFETQARRVAAAYQRKERSLVQYLSPAAAAIQPLVTSRWEPLSPELQKSLEHAFGAGLDQVRIHRDAPAQRYVADCGAAALTAGRHVYFGPGRFDDRSETGRELIAHEIAHVLQQTGRRDAEGRLHATPIEGSGRLMLQSLEPEFTSRRLFEEVPSLDTVIGRHLKDNADDEELKEHTEKVKSLIGDFSDKHPKTKDLVDSTKDKSFPKSATVRAFYFDCLKALGEDRAALTVASGVPRETSFGLLRFYNDTLRSDVSWVTRTMESFPLLRKYWLNQFVDTFRVYLFGPARPEWGLDYNQPFEKVYEEALEAGRDPSGLIGNERFFFALAALKEIDERRRQALRINREALEKNPSASRIEARRVLAENLAKDGVLETVFGRLSGEATELAREAIPAIRALAKTAQSYWSRIRAFATALAEHKVFEGGVPAEIVAEIKRTKIFASLEADLVGYAGRVFTLPGGRTPSAASYRQILQDAQGHLLQIMRKHDQALVAEQRKSARAEQVSDRLLILLGWVQFILDYLRLHLGGFAPPKKKASETDLEERARADALVKHRLTHALLVWGIARALDFPKLLTFAEDVRFGRQKPQLESEFAIDGDWTEDKNAAPGDMVKDFPPGARVVPTPLTIDDFDKFFYALYADALAADIRKVLEKRGQDFSPEKGPVLNEALDRVAKLDRPRRWVLKKFYASIREADDEGFGPNILAQHPRYEVFRADQEARGVYPLFAHPFYPYHEQGIVVWTLPSLNQLRTLLETIDGLPELVNAVMAGNEAAYEEERARAVKTKQKLPPLGRELIRWFDALRTVLTSHAQFKSLVERTLMTRFNEAVTALRAQTRRATSHQRRVILENKVIPLWTAYEVSVDKISTYTNPNQALQWMMRFAGEVQPPEDRQIQLAAMVLELGPLLWDKLGTSDTIIGEMPGTGRIDIIASLLPHLEGTLNLLDDKKLRAEVLGLDVRLPKKYDAHVEAVRKLKESTGATLIETQRHVVFEGNAKGQSLTIAGEGYPLIAGVENAIDIEGNNYALIEVYESFTYSPGVNMGPGRVHWPPSKSGQSILKDATGKDIDVNDRKSHKLFKILRNNSEIIVTADNDHILGELSYVLVMHNLVRQMQDLAEVMEAAARLGLELAELIPGWGQAIMVVRFLTTILLFISSPEFEDLKEALSGDSGDAITKVFSQLSEAFNADVLWGFVLFGEPKILPALKAPEEGAKRAKVRKKYKGGAAARLGGLLARLGKLALRLGGRIAQLADKFQKPMHRMNLFVHSRPLVALVLRVMLDNFARLKALQLRELELGADFNQKRITEEINELTGQVTNLLEHIQELELPMDVVPLDQIVDVTVELVLDLLGGKYKKGVRVIQFGLEKIGAWQKIVGAITKELKAARLDPNIIWQETIRAELQPHLEKVTASFADTAGDIVNRVPFLKGAKAPAAPAVTLTPEEGEFPESEGYRDADTLPAFAGAPLQWPQGGGAPLTPRLAGQMARGFGHDFSHVRLHADGESDALTRRLGSRAITSGSHVYLRRDVSPRDDAGGHVLRHELAHVLQQSGPRPLGGQHSNQPVEGRAGGGLRYDAGREAVAETAADLSKAPGHGRPIDAGRGALGPQPAFDKKLESVIKRFFKEVGKDKPLHDFVHDIDRGAVGKVVLDAHAREVTRVLSDKVLAALKNLKSDKKAFNEPFRSQHEAIVDYVVDDLARAPAFKDVVTALVKRGMEPKRVKKKNDAGDTVATTEWKFNRNRLEATLEEYLFGRTGVYFNIEFRSKKGGPIGDQSIDLDDPFKSFRVLTVYLALIGGTAKLWDIVVDNTWVKNTPLMVPASRFKSLKNEAVAQYKGKARLVLSAIGPDPRVFQRTEFRFSNDIAKQIEEEVFPTFGGRLPVDLLPPWEDYVKDAQPPNYNPKHGQIALRFGRYSENTKPQKQFGTERDAHHVPQFLLLEYFRNEKASYKPFQHSLSLYPGVDGAGSFVKTIAKPGGTRVIKIQEFWEKRSGRMPTILVSKHAHMYGNLHVHAKPDDAPGASASSPGFAVHDAFMSNLGDYRPILDNRSSTSLTTIKKQSDGKKLGAKEQPVTVGGKPVSEEMLQTAIYDAVNKTFTWMRDDMLTKLKDGLRTEEVHYYRQTAARSTNPAIYDPGTKEIKPAFDLKPGGVDKVVPEFKKHIKTIAEDECGFEGEK